MGSKGALGTAVPRALGNAGQRKDEGAEGRNAGALGTAVAQGARVLGNDRGVRGMIEEIKAP